jgi:predicted esterase
VKRNIQTGENLNIIFTTLTDRSEKLNYNYGIYTSDNTELKKSIEEVQTVSGLNTNESSLPVSDLPPGDYTIKWNASGNTEGSIPLTILPVINYEYEKSALGKLKNKTNEGGYNTLMFMLQDALNNYKSVKPYETATHIRISFQTYKSYVTELETGTDSLKLKRGTFRRAFLSGIDNTLQPYSVKVPENYNSRNKYPLFVMLHGSGSDDTEMLTGTPLTENNFIEIAPYGRGTSNCFTVDSSQADIKEAIEDAIKNYSIDASRIIIAGFSMGGYGAYRTYFEHPEMFRAVAVFSGHPNLPSKWFAEGFPDFLNDEYLKPFKGIPVFVYHSKNDLNCPYELTQNLVSKLTKAGAKVQFVVSEESGHGIINNENIPVYYQWLKSVTGK